MKVKKKEKSSSVQLKKRNLQPKENRRSSGSQQKLGGVTYESYNGFENISANKTKNISLPTNLPEERHKNIESCTV